jgi:hypothetical protein
VREDAKAPERTANSRPARAKSVTRAAAGGSRRELLVAMRSRVARAVEARETPPRDLASLTRRLLEIAKEIEAIDKAAEEEARDASAAADEEFDSSAV